MNSVGSVAEFDAKKDDGKRCPIKPSEWCLTDFLEPGETLEECAARHGVTLQKEDVPERVCITPSAPGIETPQVENENQMDLLKQIRNAVNRICDILTQGKMAKAK